jgi:DeoR/GlpR family transcriptional regulator of sugar metabolism
MTTPSETLSSEERQQQISTYIDQQQRITIAQICEWFDVSEATARRDLDALAEIGLVRRVHGGAIAAQQAPPEPPILKRSREQSNEKQAMARAAASLITDNDTIFLGSGSSVLALAYLLRKRRLTVITNSLAVINILSSCPSIELVSLGGSFRPSELSFIGHITELSLAEVRADKVFIGIRSIDLQQGLTNDHLPETLTDRAILRIGRETIILADHTKFARISSSFVAPVEVITTLITDMTAPADFIATLRELGVQVLQVGPEV